MCTPSSCYFSHSFTFLCLLLSLCFYCLCNILQFRRSTLLSTKCVWYPKSHFLSGSDNCPQAAYIFCTNSFPCCTSHCLGKILVCTWAGAAKHLRNISLDSVGHLHQISYRQWIFSTPPACCHVDPIENKDSWQPVSQWFLVAVHSEVGEGLSGQGNPWSTSPHGTLGERGWLRGQDNRTHNERSVFRHKCKTYLSSQIAFGLYCLQTRKSAFHEAK